MFNKAVIVLALIGASLCSSKLISTPTVEELPSYKQHNFGITKRHVNAVVGDTIELHCYGARDYIWKLIWHKGGDRIGNYGRISFTSTTTKYYHDSKITISNVTKGWSGRYTCQGTTIPGERMNNTVYLHVRDS